MKRMRLKYSVSAMCRIFKVSKSGFYIWLNSRPSRHSQEEQRLELEIRRRTGGPVRPVGPGDCRLSLPGMA